MLRGGRDSSYESWQHHQSQQSRHAELWLEERDLSVNTVQPVLYRTNKPHSQSLYCYVAMLCIAMLCIAMLCIAINHNLKVQKKDSQRTNQLERATG